MEFKEYIKRKFGITLPDYLRTKEGNKVQLYNKEVEKFEDFSGSKVIIFNKGLNAGRTKENHYKPTTDFLQIFGFMATRNIIILNKREASQFLSGKTIKINNDLNAENGYVVVFYEGKAIGCGLLKEGKILESNIPKWRRIEL